MNPIIEIIYMCLVSYGLAGGALSIPLMIIGDMLPNDSRVAAAIWMFNLSTLSALCALVPVLFIGLAIS